MKTHLLKLLLLTNHLGCRPQRARIASALLALTLFALAGPVAHAQTTAFTYQGSLADGGRPANGNYDFRFTLHDAPNGGVPVAGPLTNAPVTVSNGLFTTTLDFGAGAFPGADRYLEIATRTTGVAIAYTSLTPLQKVNSAPYANRALVAGEAVRAASVADARFGRRRSRPAPCRRALGPGARAPCSPAH